MKTPKISLPSSKIDVNLTPGATAPAMKAADAKAAATSLYRVPIDKIKPIPGFNVRVASPDYTAHRDMLIGSIKANGFDETKPLAGYVAKEGDENVIYVTDGYTRLDAANAFNSDPDTAEDREIKTLPVIVRTSAPSLEDLTVALHTNNTGRPLTPFELGVVVKRLMRDEGADKAAIAARLSVTPRYLDDVLLLVNGPKAVRDAVLEGEVSSTMAIQQLRKAGDNPAKAAEAITAAVASAKAKGKKTATAKDTGPKMVKIKHTVSVGAGEDMKEIVKAAAAAIRASVNSVPHATDPEAKVADVDGTITIIIQVPAPTPEPKAAKPKKPAKASAAPKAAAAKTSKPKGGKKAEASPSPAPEASAPAPESDTDNDLGIAGAEEVTSDGIDDEPAMLPPAVKSDTEEDVSDI